MSPRVLFCCWPFEGHVFPQLAIALAVRARGGEVAFYTGTEHQAKLEAEGVPVFPFSRVQSKWEEVRAAEARAGGRRKSVRVEQRAFRQWLVETIPDQVGDLRSVIAEFRPDLIVVDASMWGPSLVLRETESIPVALASPLIYACLPGPDSPPPGSGLPVPRSRATVALSRTVEGIIDVAARPMRRRINALRAGYGLPALRAGVNEQLGELDLYLVLSIPELDLNRWDLPASVHYVGSCLWHPPEPPAASDWLRAIPTDRPWVHVTEGTSHFQDPFVLRAAVDGLSGEPVQVIISHGREKSEAEQRLGAPAPNIHLTRWVSHETLLPRCAAMVTTGGAGSVMAGIRAGIPLVIVPTTWDKPDNARRIAEAGAGIILRPRRCNAAALREAVLEVLSEPSYQIAAQRYAQALQAAPGPDGAAALIEDTVQDGPQSTGQPVARRPVTGAS